MPMPKRQLQDDFEHSEKQIKNTIAQIRMEQEKPKIETHESKIDTLLTKLGELDRPSRAVFQEPFFRKSSNDFMHGEELAKTSKKERNEYRKEVLKTLKTLNTEHTNSPSQKGRSVRFKSEPRTWGQFLSKTLGLAKGKGTKRKRKAKGKITKGRK